MKTILEFKSTLKFNDKLNPKLWHENKLKQNVRKKLLDIGKAWVEYAKIPEIAVEEYIFVGGLAGFNYTKFSDIDLHVVVDKQKISECEDLLDEYLKDKKELWSLRDITIYGYDVEVYAQDDQDDFNTTQAVYSLTKDEWIIEPRRSTFKQELLLKDSAFIQKVKKYQDYINNLIEGESPNIETLEKLKEKLKKLRQDSLKEGGEYSMGNLVFKELRNRGTLDKMNEYMKSVQDKMLSLK